jgi:S1-C subfamily serine protease
MTARISSILLLAFVIAAVPSFVGAQTWSTSSDRSKGWLGVETQDVTGRLRDRNHLSVDAGAYVSNVIEDSPAEDAGIQEGDVITKVDGKKIDDADDLTSAIRKIKPETDAKIEIDRKGEKKTLTAKIDRARAPEALTFRFDGGRDHRIVIPRMPKMPRMPQLRRNLHVFVNDDTYGLELQELSRQLADYFSVPSGHGLLVSSVKKGSSAEQAGFKAGDVLVKLDGETIRDMGDFHDATRGARGDKEVPCDIIRKGKTESLKWKVDTSGDEEEEDDDYSFRGDQGSLAPSAVDPGCCETSQTRIGALKARLESLHVRLLDRFTHLKDVLSSKLSALWRPIEEKFS